MSLLLLFVHIKKRAVVCFFRVFLGSSERYGRVGCACFDIQQQ
jgi:hypothetical protein